jgi:hypothetical protein
MKRIHEFQAEGYYLFESMSGARSCYFESEKEISIFKKLWSRYMSSYTETYKQYFSSEGYQILLKIKSVSIIHKRYINRCKKKKKELNPIFLKETWRIISEQVRIFHSVYAKTINVIRGREGVLVKNRYRRYYFDGYEEFKEYERKMDEEERIKTQ